METIEIEKVTEEIELKISEEEFKEILFLIKESGGKKVTIEKLIEQFNSQSEEKIENKAMSYSQFTLREAMETFEIKDDTELYPVLFQDIEAIEPSKHLQEVLKQNKIIPAISEKARSENIITPLLVELAQMNKGKFNILSGERMDVNTEKGLSGECDYIFHTFSQRMVLLEPVFALVEAKKGDIVSGFGQCLAQMIGARELNKSKNTEIPVIYGCVTNADIWRFLKLENNILTIDDDTYYRSEIGKILGIFQFIVDGFLENRKNSKAAEEN